MAVLLYLLAKDTAVRFLLLASSLLLAGAANAQNTWSTYDWQSGNSYNSYSDSQGTTTHGFNAQTGSMWNQRQNSNGTYSGTDSDGNYYYGDNNTGYYSNPSAGVTCFGTGALRTCY